jgi:hypothetical protein
MRNTRQIETAFVRLQTYVARAQLAAEHGDVAQAMADTAEIYFIANQLWEWFQKEATLPRDGN